MMYLNIDPLPQNTRWFGQVSSALAMLVLPMVTYQDQWLLSSPQSISPARLCGAFFQAVSARYEGVASPTLNRCRSLLVEAGREAINTFPEAAAKGVGALLYSVIFRLREKDRWVVFNLGSNVVLRVTKGEILLVLKPHSPVYEPNQESLLEQEMMDFGTVSTAALEPEFKYEGEIRGAELELGGSDWLIVAPGTSAALHLRVERQPENLRELESRIINKLTGPYLSYPPSWIAVHSLEDDLKEVDQVAEETGAGS